MYKSVYDLTREELIELKERYYCDESYNVSYGELANIDEIVSDEEIFTEYDEYVFCDDDFFCNM